MGKLRWIIVIYLVLLALVTGTAVAAEFAEQENYLVAADTVIADDLYVSATTVTIDGRVDGDLVVLGNYVEINGTVSGDLLVIAAGVYIAEEAEIGDDARLLVGSAVIDGRVGDDLLMTGSGNGAAPIPLQSGSRTLDLGMFLRGAQVGGDVVAMGGLAELSGTIGGDVQALVTSLAIEELTAEGSAVLTVTEINADEASRFLGENGFAYEAPQPLNVPSSLSQTIVYNEPVVEESGIDLFTLLRRMVGTLAGMAILGWLLLRFRPNWLIEPTAVLATEPLRCLFVGFMVTLAFLFVPVATVLLMVLVGFFWGIGVALAAGGLVVLLLVLVWVISPLLVGMWVGHRFSRQPFGAMMLGTLLIVIFIQLPFLGLGISGTVFMAAVGALILARPIDKLPAQV